MRDGETKNKYLYIHFASDHFKSKIRVILSLDNKRFKRRCKNICDVDLQLTRKATIKINYSDTIFNKTLSESKYFFNKQKHILQQHY